LKIIDSIIPHIAEDGEGCFIHPARWYEDPLAKYKKNSDQVKFKRIVDRLEDVKIMETREVETAFGITRNGDLMISRLKSRPTGKKIEIYDDMVKEALDIILPYTKEHNLDEHIEESKAKELRDTRRDILEFCNACMNRRRHTKEQFEFVLRQCDDYEDYIEKNHVKNGVVAAAIKEIRRLNAKCIQENSYLKEGVDHIENEGD
jgi:hypothetical protein